MYSEDILRHMKRLSDSFEDVSMKQQMRFSAPRGPKRLLGFRSTGRTPDQTNLTAIQQGAARLTYSCAPSHTTPTDSSQTDTASAKIQALAARPEVVSLGIPKRPRDAELGEASETKGKWDYCSCESYRSGLINQQLLQNATLLTWTWFVFNN